MGSSGTDLQLKSKVKHVLSYFSCQLQSAESCRHITFVGATIIVLMLLFDPFLQQVVTYPDRLVPSDKAATIVRAQSYVARSEEGLPLPSIVDMSMKVCATKRPANQVADVESTTRPLSTMAYLTFETKPM